MAILLYLMACLMSPPPLIHLAESRVKTFVTTSKTRSTPLCVRSTPPYKHYTYVCPCIFHNHLAFSLFEGREHARVLRSPLHVDPQLPEFPYV
jgi:hypothetical protein